LVAKIANFKLGRVNVGDSRGAPNFLRRERAWPHIAIRVGENIRLEYRAGRGRLGNRCDDPVEELRTDPPLDHPTPEE